jgi:hypothetical protein
VCSELSIGAPGFAGPALLAPQTALPRPRIGASVKESRLRRDSSVLLQCQLAPFYEPAAWSIGREEMYSHFLHASGIKSDAALK